MKFITLITILAVSVYHCRGSDVQTAYVEENEWTMIPDGYGNMKMIQLKDVLEDPTPLFVPAQDVVMVIRTQTNTGGTVVPLNNAAALAASGYNHGHQTRFTIHGWNGGQTSGVNTGGQSSHHAHPTLFNMIVVDWSAGAVTANYIAARNNLDVLGPFLGQYVNWLVSLGTPLNNIYCIGHSLGGHACGMCGKSVNGLMHTIVALDPAGPLFSVADVNRRVDAGDAQYVEIIHSNGNLLGFGDPIGDADFYPNGGNSQPGCGIDISGACAHDRAVLFWIESINPPTSFSATQCLNFGQIASPPCTANGPGLSMGNQPSNHGATLTSGIFFLTTAASSPFALG